MVYNKIWSFHFNKLSLQAKRIDTIFGSSYTYERWLHITHITSMDEWTE